MSKKYQVRMSGGHCLSICDHEGLQVFGADGEQFDDLETAEAFAKVGEYIYSGTAEIEEVE